MSRLSRILLALFVLFYTQSLWAAFTIERTSSSAFYYDLDDSLEGMYVSYKVTNTGAAEDDVWVDVGSFGIGDQIGLAPNEDGIIQLGSLATNESKTAFFYLRSLGDSAAVQTHTISVYDTRPPTGAVSSQVFTLTLEKNIRAAANKVVTVVTGPNPPELGGEVTITVSGSTGQIGSAKVLAFSPATFANWPADIYQLTTSTFTLSAPNAGVYVDQLVIDPADIGSKSDTDYTLVYTFKALGVTTGPTAVSPVGFISSGNQVKHTDTSGFAGLDPILPPANSTTIISKSSDVSTLPSGGGLATYTVTLNNAGSVDVTLGEILDTLPVGATYVSGSSTYAGVAISDPTITGSSGSGFFLSWVGTFDILSGVGISELVYQVSIAGADGIYTNSVVGFVNETQIDISLDTTSDDPASVDVVIGSPTAASDLSLTKIVDNAAPLEGDTIVYTLTLNNAGPDAASNVTVTDVLPTGVTYVSDDSTGAYVGDVWTIGTVAASGSAVLNITATVDTGTAGTVISNVAGVSASDSTDPDSSVGNVIDTNALEDDEALVDISVAAAGVEADLSITKTDGVVSALPGGSVTYNIVVGNAGPTDVLDASVTDTFDPLIFDVASVSWTCAITTSGSGVDLCDVASGSGNLATTVDLSTGAAATYTLNAPILLMATGSISNTATVAPPAGVADTITANNTATDADTVITPSADLRLSKITSNSSPAKTDVFSFTLTLDNDGPLDATGVVVTDTMPGAFTFVSANPAADYNDATGVWTVGTLAANAQATLVITVQVRTNANSPPYTNVAEVTAVNEYDPDSTPNNGVTTEDDYSDVQINVGSGSADLQITKTDGLVTALPGSSISYTIVVTNSASSVDDVLAAVVADTFDPSFFDVASVSWNCAITTTGGGPDACAAASGTGDINTTVDLSVGAAATYTVTAPILLSATGTLSNTASVTAPITIGDIDPLNNSASDTDTVLSLSSDLSLTKVVDNAAPLVGQNVTYTIVVSNAGANDTTGVTVVDTLPGGLTYVPTASVTGGDTSESCSATGQVITCTLGTLTTTSPETISITASVDAGTEGTTLSNIAEITASDNTDPDSTPANHATLPGEDDSATADVSIPSVADLSLSKTLTSGDTTPAVGDTVTYDVVVSNAGPNTATAVEMEDVLQTGLNFTSALLTGGAGTECTEVTGTITCVLGDINAATSKTVVVTASIATGTEGTTLNNTAEVSVSAVSDPDSTPNNHATLPGEDDSASVDVTVAVTASADLSLSKTLTSGDTTPAVGDTVTYDVIVTNAGPDTATAVEIEDVLQTGLNFTSAVLTSGAGTECTEVTGTITCLLGDINVATSKTVVVTASIATGTEGTTLNNTAEVSVSSVADPDSTPNNHATLPGEDDSASVDVTVESSSDLSLSKVVNNASPLVAQNVTYTIVVSNAGANDTTGVTVVDTLPGGLTYVPTATVTGGDASESCSATGQVITCSLGTLTTTSPETISITASVDAGTEGTTLSNIAEVTASANTDPDSTPANHATLPGEDDSATADISIPPVADLSLSKTLTSGDTTPAVGDTVTYDVIVSNAGPNTATGVEIEDVLQTGLNFSSALLSGGTGTECTEVTGTITCVVGDINASTSKTVVVTASIATGTEGTTLNNTAQVSVSSVADPDSTPNNHATLPGEDDSASVDVTVEAAAVTDLSISKTDGVVSAIPGMTLSYTIAVSNAGPLDVLDAVVVDTFDPLVFDVVNVTWTCTITQTGSGVDNCDVASGSGDINTTIDLSNGATASYTISAPLLSGATGGVSNVSTFTPPAGVTDSNLVNNTASDTDTVLNPSADLSLTKLVNNPTPIESDTIIYTLTLNNAGPSDATNVVITDLLPTGVSYVSDDGAGAYVDATGLWTIGTVTASANAVLNITVTVDAGTNGSMITNVSEVTASDAADSDSTVNNGVTTEDDYATADINVGATGVNLSGNVYEDIDTSAVQDNGEDWTSGVTVFANLVQAGAVVQSVQVDPGTGAYSFSNVADNNYSIVITDSAINTVVVAPTGWIFINPDLGQRDVTIAGVAFEFQNFGLYHGSVLSGTVFEDDGASLLLSIGTANDGIQNGEEVGLEGVSVRAADDLAGTTIYDTAITDANGNYLLYIPDSLPDSTVLITETNVESYVSTAGVEGTTAGAYVLATDTMTFSYVAGTTYTGVNFADVLDNTFSNDGQRTTFAGTFVSYPHEFTAGSEGAVTFSTSDVSTPTNTGWIETLYQDADCDGVIDAGDNEITAAIALNTGESVCIIHSQLAPVGASYNDQNEVTITASFAYANSSVVRVYTRTDVTTIGDAVADDLNLVKSVDKAAALPGETLTYTISYSNTKTDPLDDIVITDTTPAFTTFVSATCITPLANNITGCVVSVSPSVGGTGDIEWTLSGSLLSTASGSVEFQVVVDP